MYCPNCGKQLPDNSRFCDNCGSMLNSRIPSNTSLPDGIFLCDDGKYRWVYEINLWKNNVIVGSLIKVMLFVIFIIIVPVLLITGTDFISILMLIPAFLLGAALLTFIGYAINAMMNGGKYCAVFTMDEEKIIHAQSKKQVDKGRIMAILSTVAFNDAATGLSLLASEKFVTSYKDVKNIKSEPAKNLIRVNESLIKNQIYVYPHQFNFVYDYIVSRCPGAAIKER